MVTKLLKLKIRFFIFTLLLLAGLTVYANLAPAVNTSYSILNTKAVVNKTSNTKGENFSFSDNLSFVNYLWEDTPTAEEGFKKVFQRVEVILLKEVVVAAPTVVTEAVTNITGTTAILNGKITVLGSPDIIEYGFFWSATVNSNISGVKINLGSKSNTGIFSSNISGLNECTIYYVQTYASNGTDLVYGNEEVFTTIDITAPVITCTVPLASYNTDAGQCDATLSFTATATDNCAGFPAISYNIGGTSITFPYDFPIGSTIVNAVANDGNGQTATCSFTVKVIDNEAPVLTASANQNVNLDGSCEITVPDVRGTAMDNCTVTITQSPVVSAKAPVVHNGTVSVTVTATDAAGLTDVKTVVLTAKDVTPPTATCQNISVNLDASGNATITPAQINNGSNDACGTVNLVSVTPNTFTCANLGANTVTLNINDGNGNTDTCQATVTVQPYTTNATVSYTKSPNVTTVCDFETITFTAQPLGLGGDTATYEWFVNNVSKGTGTSFSYNSWTAPNDDVKIVMTVGSGSCAPTKEYQSTITVNAEKPVSFSISGPASVCDGVNAAFSIASAINIGSNPTYQWKLNGTNVGTNSSSLSLSTATGLTVAGPNVVTLEITSNATCATPAGPVASSNNIAVTVNPNSTISDPSNKNQTLCIGTTLVSNGGNIVFSIGGGATSASVSGLLPPGVSGSYSGGSFTISGTPTASGTFNYTVNTSGGGCTQASQFGTLTVTPNATISKNAADNNTQMVCSGQAIAPIRYTIGGSATTANVTGLPAGITGSLNSGVFTLSGSATIASTTTYNYTVEATGGCSPASLTGIITINPNLTPTISITATDTDICAGESVTFNIDSKTNGGTNPTYQWQRNNVNVGGATNNFFTTTTLNNGDTVRLIMTSNETCVTSSTATSAAITITVNPNLTPTVSIVSNDADNTICPGNSVLFTATPTNGGTAPLYQWKINGTNVGGNTTANTFNPTALTNGQKVTVVMTSNATCLATNNVTSNEIPITVLPNLTPSVTIVSNDADNNICQGASVTFTATPTNGGTAPFYQWKIGTADVGTNSPTFMTSALPTGAVVSVVMTTNYQCSTSAIATSNTLTHTRYTPLTTEILSGPNGICPANTNVVYSVPLDSNVLTYNWVVPSGFIINSGQGTRSISLSFTTPSTGPNNISVTRSNPCTANQTTTLSVNVQNFASVNAGPDQYVCVGTPSIRLQGSIGGAVGGNGKQKWDWSFPNGGSIPNNQKSDLNATYSLPSAAAGSSFIVRISTNTNVAGCTGVQTDDMVVYVRANPTATISGTSSVCTGTGTNITFNGTPNTTVTYKINNGTNQTINLGAAGSAVVTTGNLTANASYSLVNVGYTNPESCTINLTGTAVVTVNPDATISNSDNKNQTVCINTATANISFALGGGATNATVTGLPTGMSGSLSGTNYIISGTPTQTGTFNYTVNTTGTCVQTQQTGTITVNPDATITDPSNEDKTLCVNTNLTNIVFTVGGGATGATVTGLPAGVTFNYNASGKTFTISGTPTAVGSFPYTVTTTGTCLPATHTGTLTVTPNGAITTPANLTQSICINQDIVDIEFTISGGATTASASNLPPGLSLVNTSGNTYTISGTATTSGIYNYTVNTTGTCAQVSKNGTITVTGDATISNPGNKDQTLCINTPIANISFAIGGTATGATVAGLPAGIIGSLSGGSYHLSGTPTVSGTFNYDVTTEGLCGNVTQSGQLIIDPDDTITTPGNVDQIVCLGNAVANITFAIGGGATSATVSGLPSGVAGNLSGNNFVISGIATQAGVFNYMVTTSGACASANSGGTLTIKDAVSIGTQPGNIGVCVTDPASISVGASGDDLTYQWYKGTPGSGTIVNNNPPQITGATSNTLSFGNASLADAGDYYVRVSGNVAAGCSFIESTAGQLNVNQDISITDQPDSITECVGNDITFTVKATGTIGSYQWKKGGVDFNGGNQNDSTSGTTTTFTLEIQNIAAGDAGNYTLQLISNGGTCPEANTNSAILTITQLPTATIGYSGPYCSDDASLKSVTLDGTNAYTGGTYTAVVTSGGPNLDIDTNNGNIDPSNSDPGTYTVTYTIAASGGCAPVTTNASVTITPLPTITQFNYSSLSYCETDSANIPVNLTATNNSGATFTVSPSSGLNINLSDGTITPNGSTVGDYTVTYTIPASAGCGKVEETTTVTINPLPVATFSYDSSPYCSNGGNPTITLVSGAETGIFSSTSGLVFVNASTGEIDIANTAPGTYTVTNTIAAAGGCIEVEDTSVITITKLPVAGFSYAGSPYCSDGGNPTITLASGAETGIFSSTSGLVFTNASTGEIDMATSTPGTYTVTNTIAAANGCSIVTSTANITITKLPDATFSYTQNAYCVTDYSATVSAGYEPGGSFSSTNLGSHLNTSTGKITWTDANTLNGNYDITYTFVAAGGCGEVSETTYIQIDPIPVGGKLEFAGNGRLFMTCKNAAPGYAADLTLSGYAGQIVEWEYHTASNLTWQTFNSVSPTLTSSQVESLVPNESTVFRVKVINGACNYFAYSATAIVSVIPADIKPAPVAVAPKVLCFGDQITLSSSTGYGESFGQFEGGDFDNAGIKNHGWDFTNPSGGSNDFSTKASNGRADHWLRMVPHGSSPNDNEKVYTANIPNPIPALGTMVNWDSSSGSSGNKGFALVTGDNDSYMETPVFSLTGLDEAILTFDQAYNLTAGATISVEISTNSGSTYTEVLFSITGDGTISTGSSGYYTSFGDGTPITRPKNKMVIDLGDYLGQPNLRIRFNYNGAIDGDVWAVDNIKVPEGPQGVLLQWFYDEDPTNSTQEQIGQDNQEVVTFTPRKIGWNDFVVRTALLLDSNGNACESLDNFINVRVFVFDQYTTTTTATTGGCGATNVQLSAAVSGGKQGEIIAYPTLDGYTGEWNIQGPAGYTLSNADGSTVGAINNPNANFTAADMGSYTFTWNLILDANLKDENGQIIVNAGCIPNYTGADIELKGCTTLDFDGVDDFVDLGTGYDGDYSIEAWIRPYPRLKGDGTFTDASKGTIISTKNLEINMSDLPSSVVPNTRWYHIAVDSDGKLYVDGINVNKTISATGTDRAFIGARWTPPKTDNHFSGWIEEVRIWDGKITEDQIRFTMNQRLQNSANIGVEIPLPAPGFGFGILKGYFQLLTTTIKNGGYTPDNSLNLVDGKLRNMNTWQENTAPLPYTSAFDGDWDVMSTWTQPVVWEYPNSKGIDVAKTRIDWNIVRISHNINSKLAGGAEGITLLGLISTTGELTMNDPNDGQDEFNKGRMLWITHYLKLDGFIDLVGESQLLQKRYGYYNDSPVNNNYITTQFSESVFEEASSGYIERDQQGQKSSFNYNYWSSPVSPQGTSNNAQYSVGSILKDGTNSSSPIDIDFGDGAYFADFANTGSIKITNRWIWSYNASTVGNDAWTNYYQWNNIKSNGLLKTGEGYIMKGTGGAAPVTSMQNYVFKGKPHSGTIPLSTSPGNSYLIGNPYPSAMDADEFIKDNIQATIGGKAGRNTKNIFNGALYFWDHFINSNNHILAQYEGGYATYTLLGGVEAYSNSPLIVGGSGTKKATRYIPVGQGFFIDGTLDMGGTVAVDGGPIVLKNSQRVFERESPGNSVFMKGVKAKGTTTAIYDVKDIDLRPKIRLQFNSPLGFQRVLLVGVDERTTNNFDIGFDGPLNGDNKEDMFWLIGKGKLVIQGVNNFNEDQELPLGLKISKAGLASIKIEELKNMDENIILFIKDKFTGKTHNISHQPFEIALEPGEYLDRFALIFRMIKLVTNDVTSGVLEVEPITEDNNYHVFMNNTLKELQIKNNGTDEIRSVALYNNLGQTMITWNKDLNRRIISLPVKLATGVYIVQINTKNGASINKRIIIE